MNHNSHVQPTASNKNVISKVKQKNLVALNIFTLRAAMNHIYNVNGTNQLLEQLLSGDTQDIWTKRTINECVLQYH